MLKALVLAAVVATASAAPESSKFVVRGGAGAGNAGGAGGGGGGGRRGRGVRPIARERELTSQGFF